MTKQEYLKKVIAKEYPKAEILGVFEDEITFYPDPDNPNPCKALKVLAAVYSKGSLRELPRVDILDEF